MLATTVAQYATFIVAGAICLGGALGVVALRNPVHNALSLVATLFGVAVLYVAQGAYFLAAIQVIVYAGAIVVLFLFVIMLLGVDRFELLYKERRPSSLLVGAALGAGTAVLVLIAVLAGTRTPTGMHSVTGPLRESADLNALGEALFTKYVFAFEITSLLLTIAVVGAVVLSRKPDGDPIDLDEFPEPETDDESDPAEVEQ
ncbi:MAG: NADH-quinone oxidoreductase subunit J [Acidimicrobiales bacterium]